MADTIEAQMKKLRDREMKNLSWMQNKIRNDAR